MLRANELTPRETEILRALNEHDWQGRRIIMGYHPRRISWTDGRSWVAVDRDYVASLKMETAGGVSALVATLFHEMSHDASTGRATWEHGIEFYKRYHDLTQDCNGDGKGPLAVIVAVYEMLRRTKDQRS